MTVFVQRINGAIVGVYANRNAGIADEQLDESSPEVVSFLTPPPGTEDVKREAARRIDAIMPDYQQRNALAMGLEATQLHGADPANWPAPLQGLNDSIQAKWSAIKAIRAASNVIEALNPIPLDFAEDSWWP